MSSSRTPSRPYNLRDRTSSTPSVSASDPSTPREARHPRRPVVQPAPRPSLDRAASPSEMSATESVSRPPDSPLSLHNLRSWRKTDLIAECRRRQLPVTGNKPDLRLRLEAYIRQIDPSAVADDSLRADSVAARTRRARASTPGHEISSLSASARRPPTAKARRRTDHIAGGLDASSDVVPPPSTPRRLRASTMASRPPSVQGMSPVVGLASAAIDHNRPNSPAPALPHAPDAKGALEYIPPATLSLGPSLPPSKQAESLGGDRMLSTKLFHECDEQLPPLHRTPPRMTDTPACEPEGDKRATATIPPQDSSFQPASAPQEVQQHVRKPQQLSDPRDVDIPPTERNPVSIEPAEKSAEQLPETDVARSDGLPQPQPTLNPDEKALSPDAGLTTAGPELEAPTQDDANPDRSPHDSSPSMPGEDDAIELPSQTDVTMSDGFAEPQPARTPTENAPSSGTLPTADVAKSEAEAPAKDAEHPDHSPRKLALSVRHEDVTIEPPSQPDVAVSADLSEPQQVQAPVDEEPPNPDTSSPTAKPDVKSPDSKVDHTSEVMAEISSSIPQNSDDISNEDPAEMLAERNNMNAYDSIARQEEMAELEPARVAEASLYDKELEKDDSHVERSAESGDVKLVAPTSGSDAVSSQLQRELHQDAAIAILSQNSPSSLDNQRQPKDIELSAHIEADNATLGPPDSFRQSEESVLTVSGKAKLQDSMEVDSPVPKKATTVMVENQEGDSGTPLECEKQETPGSDDINLTQSEPSLITTPMPSGVKEREVAPQKTAFSSASSFVDTKPSEDSGVAAVHEPNRPEVEKEGPRDLVMEDIDASQLQGTEAEQPRQSTLTAFVEEIEPAPFNENLELVLPSSSRAESLDPQEMDTEDDEGKNFGNMAGKSVITSESIRELRAHTGDPKRGADDVDEEGGDEDLVHVGEEEIGNSTTDGWNDVPSSLKDSPSLKSLKRPETTSPALDCRTKDSSDQHQRNPGPEHVDLSLSEGGYFSESPLPSPNTGRIDMSAMLDVGTVQEFVIAFKPPNVEQSSKSAAEQPDFLSLSDESSDSKQNAGSHIERIVSGEASDGPEDISPSNNNFEEQADISEEDIDEDEDNADFAEVSNEEDITPASGIPSSNDALVSPIVGNDLSSLDDEDHQGEEPPWPQRDVASDDNSGSAMRNAGGRDDEESKSSDGLRASDEDVRRSSQQESLEEGVSDDSYSVEDDAGESAAEEERPFELEENDAEIISLSSGSSAEAAAEPQGSDHGGEEIEISDIEEGDDGEEHVVEGTAEDQADTIERANEDIEDDLQENRGDSQHHNHSIIDNDVNTGSAGYPNATTEEDQDGGGIEQAEQGVLERATEIPNKEAEVGVVTNSVSGIMPFEGRRRLRPTLEIVGNVETSQPVQSPLPSPDASQVCGLMDKSYTPRFRAGVGSDEAKSVLRETRRALTNLRDTTNEVLPDNRDSGSIGLRIDCTMDRAKSVTSGQIGKFGKETGRTWSQSSVPHVDVCAPPPSPFMIDGDEVDRPKNTRNRGKLLKIGTGGAVVAMGGESSALYDDNRQETSAEGPVKQIGPAVRSSCAIGISMDAIGTIGFKRSRDGVGVDASTSNILVDRVIPDNSQQYRQDVFKEHDKGEERPAKRSKRGSVTVKNKAMPTPADTVRNLKPMFQTEMAEEVDSTVASNRLEILSRLQGIREKEQGRSFGPLVGGRNGQGAMSFGAKSERSFHMGVANASGRVVRGKAVGNARRGMKVVQARFMSRRRELEQESLQRLSEETKRVSDGNGGNLNPSLVGHGMWWSRD